MPERVAKVVLSAQMQQFISETQKARRSVSELGSEAERLSQKKRDFDVLGRSGLAMGVALAAGLGMVAAKAADFDQAMSYVDAATHETAANMGLLRDAALEAGATTVFSATESANAIEELGKAGLTTKDILTGGLVGALSLAAAGGLGVADAAGQMATALQQFGLRGTDSTHVADLLAAGAGKAMGDVSDLSQALNQAGLVANSTGLSIEETTGALSAFASKGLLGSDAGTAFKTMLQNLTPQSVKAKDEMERLGISAYDASGNFVGLANFAGNLRQAMLDLTPEQRAASSAIIFGSDSVRAANVLYEEGSVGIQKWIDKVDDQGYAADTAARRLDNLKGDVEQLGGAFDTALITSGSQANDLLRFLTQSATGLVDGFNALPEPAQGAGLAVGAVGAAATLASGAFLLGAPKLAEYRDAIEGMGVGAQRTAKALGALTKGAAVGAGVVIGVEVLNQLLEKLEATEEEMQNTAVTAKDASEIIAEGMKGIATAPQGLVSGATAMTDFQTRLNNLADTSENWFATFAHGTDGTTDLNVALSRVGETLGTLAGTDLAEAQEAFGLLVDKTDGSERQINELLNRMPAFKDALTAQATALGLSADQETLVSLGLGEIGTTAPDAEAGVEAVSGAAERAAENVDGLADSIRNYGSATSELLKANSDLYQSIDDAKEAWGAEGFQATLDLTSQAGRDNTDVLLGLADAAANAAAETYENTGSQDELIAKLEEGRSALFEQARQFFDSDQAAQDYVDSLMKTPTDITTQVNLQGVTEAQAQIDAFVAQYQGKTITMQMFLESSGGDAGLAASAARYTAQAQDYFETHSGGGTVGGQGTSKSDSVYTRLSRGEEVIQEPYASMFRSELKQMNVGVPPSMSGGGTTNNWTIVAPEGPSPEVIGRSAMAYASRKQRRSFA